MIKFKRILFPTDFSPAADHALDYAISLALEHESNLIIVHVIEDIGFNLKGGAYEICQPLNRVS